MRLIRETGQPITQVARNLGITVRIRRRGRSVRAMVGLPGAIPGVPSGVRHGIGA